MLQVPTSAIKQAARSSGYAYSPIADWIEGSVLLGRPQYRRGDFLDALLDDQAGFQDPEEETDPEAAFSRSDRANSRLMEAWQELRRREKALGKQSPFAVKGTTISRRKTWRAWPEYSFCVFLALRPYYRSLNRTVFGKNYVQQGALFEGLVRNSVRAWGWKTVSAGFTEGNFARLVERLPVISNQIGVPVGGNLARWLSDDAQDGGLDVLAWLPFNDERPDQLFLLMQVKSGRDWEESLDQPSLRFWGKMLDFSSPPYKGLAMPFEIDDTTFSRKSNTLEGLLLNRSRLLAPAPSGQLPPDKVLRRRIVTWLAPKFKGMPRIDN